MADRKKRVGHKGRQKVSATSQAQTEQEKRKQIRFDYIKSNCFRVIRVDGVNGGPTPRADGIQMAFFSERMPIPQSEEFLVSVDGKLGERTSAKGRSAIVREVEVEAILSIPTAKSLHAWLDQQIKKAEEFAAKGATNVK